MKELIELPVEGLTPAMQASLLRELIKQLNIPDEKFEESAKKSPTAEERKEAVLRLNSEMNRVSEIVQDEAKVNSTEIQPITFVNQANQESSSQAEASQSTGKTIEPEVIKNPTNKNDDNNGNLVEESPEYRVQLFTADSQIQQFVIPIILDCLDIFVKPDKQTQDIIYKSEEYTASLKFELGVKDRLNAIREAIRLGILSFKDMKIEEEVTQETHTRVKTNQKSQKDTAKTSNKGYKGWVA